MLILQTSSEKIAIPVTGPVVDLSIYSVSVALVSASAGTEPADGDYQSAVWLNGEAVMLITKGQYPPGDYMAYVRVVASPEDVRLASGRVRIGDVRL